MVEGAVGDGEVEVAAEFEFGFAEDGDGIGEGFEVREAEIFEAVHGDDGFVAGEGHVMGDVFEGGHGQENAEKLKS